MTRADEVERAARELRLANWGREIVNDLSNRDGAFLHLDADEWANIDAFLVAVMRAQGEVAISLPSPTGGGACEVKVSDVVAQIIATAKALPLGAVSREIIGDNTGQVSAYNVLLYAAKKCEEIARVLSTPPSKEAPRETL